MLVEKMEARLLMYSASIVNRILYVTGDATGEWYTIQTDAQNSEIEVIENSAPVTFQNVDRAVFFLGGGNDTANIGKTAGGAMIIDVEGGDGNDDIISEEVPGILKGDAGNDYICIIGAEGRLTTGKGGTGDDYFVVAYGTLDANGNGFSVEGEDGDDTFDLSLAGAACFADGGADDDTIIGSDYNDVLGGGSGSDYIYGGLGNDVISVFDGLYNDEVDGAGGYDWAHQDTWESGGVWNCEVITFH